MTYKQISRLIVLLLAALLTGLQAASNIEDLPRWFSIISTIITPMIAFLIWQIPALFDGADVPSPAVINNSMVPRAIAKISSDVDVG